MSAFTRFTKKYSRNQQILGILLLIFIIFQINLPADVSRFVGSLPGLIVVVCIVIYLFAREGPVIGILGLIAGYQMLARVGILVNNRLDFLNVAPIPTYNNIQTLLPNKRVNGITFSPTHQFPPTLEQEVISDLVPIVVNNDPPHFKYKASTAGQNNAAPIGFKGIV